MVASDGKLGLLHGLWGWNEINTQWTSKPFVGMIVLCHFFVL
jgi:hypothetical protein